MKKRHRIAESRDLLQTSVTNRGPKVQSTRCIGEGELLSFAGKVSGKAAWSRGLHLSYAGYTPDGLEAFGRGKRTAIICMAGFA